MAKGGRSSSMPLGKAMYVASTDDSLWLLNVQRKLYARSQTQPTYTFRRAGENGKMWQGEVTLTRLSRLFCHTKPDSPIR